MRSDAEIGKPEQQYAAAHAAHHTSRDFPVALKLYQGVLAAFPDSREAGYSRTQIQNIVTRVVPPQDLLESQIQLALARLSREESTQVETAPGTPPPSGPHI